MNFYRQLIELRQMNPVLLSGDFVPLKATRSLMAYERQNSEKTWVVVLNFSEKERKNPYSGRCILTKIAEKSPASKPPCSRSESAGGG
ncbi:DUF3459 domain-containing protein [Fusibacter tunisiensis]|nr:DUF3459 domain-containing protein [Fusibacter tunisiensis]